MRRQGRLVWRSALWRLLSPRLIAPHPLTVVTLPPLSPCLLSYPQTYRIRILQSYHSFGVLLVFDHPKMSSSKQEEGAGVAPQNKGSWSSFLKVFCLKSNDHTASIETDRLLVDSIIQWRSLDFDCSSLYPRDHLFGRVFGLLDRASFHFCCTSLRARSSEACIAGTEVVSQCIEATVL